MRRGSPLGRAFVAARLVCLGAAASGTASAQTIAIDLATSSAPSPVGAGARAAGLGYAFIAVADDATAASWNPAGLVQLERPELSVVGQVAHQRDSFPEQSFESAGQTIDKAVTDGSITATSLNYLSAAVPFSLGSRNVVASINYHAVVEFDRSLVVHSESGLPGDRLVADRRFRSDGRIYAISPAFAIDVTPAISLGVALDHWLDPIGSPFAWRNRESQHYESAGPDPIVVDGESVATFESFSGTTATLGALARLPGGITIAASGRLPFSSSSRFHYLESSEQYGLSGDLDTRVAFDYPLVVGVGLSFRPADVWMLTADVTRVRWSRYRFIDPAGNRFLVSGDPVGPDNPFSSEDDPPGGFHVSDVTTVRAGVEKVVRIDQLLLSMRSGAYYDPEPSRGAPEDFFGVSAGLGLTMHRASLDLAYDVRFGFDADGLAVVRNVIGAPDGTVDQVRHSLVLSAVIYL